MTQQAAIEMIQRLKKPSNLRDAALCLADVADCQVQIEKKIEGLNDFAAKAASHFATWIRDSALQTTAEWENLLREMQAAKAELRLRIAEGRLS